MKKYLGLALALLLCAGMFFGCGNNLQDNGINGGGENLPENVNTEKNLQIEMAEKLISDGIETENGVFHITPEELRRAFNPIYEEAKNGKKIKELEKSLGDEYNMYFGDIDDAMYVGFASEKETDRIKMIKFDVDTSKIDDVLGKLFLYTYPIMLATDNDNTTIVDLNAVFDFNSKLNPVEQDMMNDSKTILYSYSVEDGIGAFIIMPVK